MKRINIICVDDERSFLDSLSQELAFFADVFNIEKCESALECLGLLEDLNAEEKLVALVIADDLMPGKNGVELLNEIEMDHRFIGTKKLLLTSSDEHENANTICKVSQSRLDYFLEKICAPDELLQTVKELITEYAIEKGLELEGYTPKLDGKALSRLSHTF
ncbi:response regulator [Psychromonas algicola]|uniref:response regulator n=1 Tax=Psychromonas algicola TaxID=2555642 RepID=UPI00106863C4|nr:response regulator [Psychromonas sp. RZ5]TEW50186.1 response regulator transcription factor [Psychromonas sp. RZ5]